MSERGGDAGWRQDLLTNIKSIVSADAAFAALKNDDSVVTWGSRRCGGDAGENQDRLINISHIVGEENAFAARRMDGDEVVWGKADSYEKALIKLHKHIEGDDEEEVLAK